MASKRKPQNQKPPRQHNARKWFPIGAALGAAAVAVAVAAFVSALGGDGGGEAASSWGPCRDLDGTIMLHVNGGLLTGAEGEAIAVRLDDVASFEQLLHSARTLTPRGDRTRNRTEAELKHELPEGRELTLHARDGRRIASLDALRELVRDAADVGEGCATAAHVSVVPEGDRWFMPAFQRGAQHTVRLHAGTPDERLASVTTLGTHPRTFQIDNFLSVAEAKQIKELASPMLRPSEVMKVDGSSRARSMIRSSDTAFLGRDRGYAVGGTPINELTDTVQRRAAELVGLDPTRYDPAPGSAWRAACDDAEWWAQENGVIYGKAGAREPWGLHQEPLQVVAYTGGTGFYRAHLDSSSVTSVPKPKGQIRLLTLLVYLTDAPLGLTPDDGTYFPLAYDGTQQGCERGDALLEQAGGDPTELGKTFDMNCSLDEARASHAVYRPRKMGSALLFYSGDVVYHSLGVVDWRALHGGCAVPEGADKWISNFWFHNIADIEYKKHLVVADYLKKANSAHAAGHTAKAVKLLKSSLKAVPHNTLLHLRIGEWLVDAGRFDEAVGHWKQAVRLHPELMDSHHGLGVALANLGRLPEAMASLRLALRLPPPASDPFHATVLGVAAAVAAGRTDADAPAGEAQALREQYEEAATKTAERARARSRTSGG